MNYKILGKFQKNFIYEKKIFSFLNHNSLYEISKSSIDYQDILFFCDGFALSKHVSIKIGKTIQRISFDFTSIAHSYFTEIEKSNLNLLVIGGSREDQMVFPQKIIKRYPKIKITHMNGYDIDVDKVLETIKNNRITNILIGMGVPKQEHLAKKIFLKQFNCNIFTCGGFISQTCSTKGHFYYPKLINALNLRFLYRIIKEPHTIRRYLFIYPYIFLRLLFTDSFKFKLCL